MALAVPTKGVPVLGGQLMHVSVVGTGLGWYVLNGQLAHCVLSTESTT